MFFDVPSRLDDIDAFDVGNIFARCANNGDGVGTTNVSSGFETTTGGGGGCDGRCIGIGVDVKVGMLMLI